MKTLLDKTYDDSSLHDAEGDLTETLDAVLKDEDDGFQPGTFRLVVTWAPKEEQK